MTDNDIIKALECGHMRVTIMQNNQNLPFLRKMGGGITMDVREKLAELIGRFCSGLSVSDITPPYGYENLADFLISNGVTVQEWISVRDRLPEMRDDGFADAFLVTDGSLAHIAYFVDGEWIFTDNGQMKEPMFYDVTHWRCLPQPPKGETIYCKDCEHLMFSDCYGECANGHKGIVNPNDTCEHAKRKPPKGE